MASRFALALGAAYNQQALTFHDFDRGIIVAVTAHRPKNLNLFTISFPIPAIVSILHRISGVALFVLLPLALYLWSYSLTREGFETLQSWFSLFWVRALVWLIAMPLCFHLVAGIRHLLMDLHLGQSKAGGRCTAWATFVIAAILVLMLGVRLW